MWWVLKSPQESMPGILGGDPGPQPAGLKNVLQLAWTGHGGVHLEAVVMKV